MVLRRLLVTAMNGTVNAAATGKLKPDDLKGVGDSASKAFDDFNRSWEVSSAFADIDILISPVCQLVTFNSASAFLTSSLVFFAGRAFEAESDNFPDK
jgi:hypothetical protein